MANKERYTVTASSLGSYFGVGFNDPLKQLMIDMGEIEDEPDEEALERMELGNIMEDASLNALERKLNISISNRNVEVFDALNGMLRVKMDGETIYNGEDTVVENKYSNSKSGPFTKNMGYVLQCQAYLLHKGWNQAILGGIYQGKVIWRIVKRDEQLISDIKEMVSAVYGILNGLLSKEDYPWHLVHKYSNKVIVEQYDTFNALEDGEYLERLSTLNEQIKGLSDEKDSIVEYLKNKYKAVVFDDGAYTINISQYQRAGGLDVTLLEMDHPELDLTKYQSEGTTVTTVRVKKKKGS